ncbi:hypothetical protein AMTR_s00030p00203660 [Amborella trichopoda]|uniref:Uncharacterized protein n=1 Tax=Amborella trichopoda TaxID=13333 RepID=U5CSB8_AMBTC|nr:hypothetical protein AMTR_s00030p00203660 [Amborella trichopoda]
MEEPPLGYRRNVGICLVNASNKILTALRLDIPGAWQLPQISVKFGVNGSRNPDTVLRRCRRGRRSQACSFQRVERGNRSDFC